jgi:hypothetical protein
LNLFLAVFTIDIGNHKEVVMNKIEVWGLKLRTILILTFVFVSLLYWFLTALEDIPKPIKAYKGTLAFWPPDLVPHPPHFPPPEKKQPS